MLACTPETGPKLELVPAPSEELRHGPEETTPEEIIAKLREIEVRLARGETTPIAVRAAGITEQTYYRWRREYCGLKVDQAMRLKDLEKENLRLRKLVSDLTLDKLFLEEAAKGVEAVAETVRRTVSGRNGRSP